jgi:hypothetical protein
MSSEWPGWRERAANLDGQTVFAVGYQICRRCQLGRVELSYIDPSYQRCGLASAGLAALHAEHPELSWLILGAASPTRKHSGQLSAPMYPAATNSEDSAQIRPS